MPDPLDFVHPRITIAIYGYPHLVIGQCYQCSPRNSRHLTFSRWKVPSLLGLVVDLSPPLPLGFVYIPFSSGCAAAHEVATFAELFASFSEGAQGLKGQSTAEPGALIFALYAVDQVAVGTSWLW